MHHANKRLPSAWVGILGLLVLTMGALTTPSLRAEIITVYKSPTCGCCGKWVDHLKQNGFAVQVVERSNMQPIKHQLGVSPALQSCHTAVVGNYIIEGHVPADDIRRLLAEKPDIKLLSVPGMPMGSPGMEGPRQDRYRVLAVSEDGSARVFAEH